MYQGWEDIARKEKKKWKYGAPFLYQNSGMIYSASWIHNSADLKSASWLHVWREEDVVGASYPWEAHQSHGLHGATQRWEAFVQLLLSPTSNVATAVWGGETKDDQGKESTFAVRWSRSTFPPRGEEALDAFPCCHLIRLRVKRSKPEPWAEVGQAGVAYC